MRIALFGGTFDPIHRGHLEAARAAADAHDLDRVLFVVSGDPPHKPDRSQASYEDRQRMAELACETDPRFEAPRLEDPKKLGGRRSYSVDTIEHVKKDLAPDDKLFFLLGADAFQDLDIWYRLEDVLEAVEFLVVSRSGEELEPRAGAKAHWVKDVDVPISSTEIRRRLAHGEPVDRWLPEEVSEHIRRHDLYREAAAHRARSHSHNCGER